jgi:hypothetical protein
MRWSRSGNLNSCLWERRCVGGNRYFFGHLQSLLFLSSSAMPRIGKSIEEIVLSRSLPSRDASPGGSFSQPLQQHQNSRLPPSRGSHGNGYLGRGSRGPSPSGLSSTSSGPSPLLSTSQSRSSVRNKQSENEKMTMETLMEHSHSLQLHVKVIHSHLSPR